MNFVTQKILWTKLPNQLVPKYKTNLNLVIALQALQFYKDFYQKNYLPRNFRMRILRN